MFNRFKCEVIYETLILRPLYSLQCYFFGGGGYILLLISRGCSCFIPYTTKQDYSHFKYIFTRLSHSY